MVRQRAAEGVDDWEKDFWVGRRTFVVLEDRREDRDDDGDPYPTTGERTPAVGMAIVREAYLGVEVTSLRHVGAAERARLLSEQGSMTYRNPYSVEELDCSTDAVVARRWRAAHGRHSTVSARGRNSMESDYST